MLRMTFERNWTARVDSVSLKNPNFQDLIRNDYLVEYKNPYFFNLV